MDGDKLTGRVIALPETRQMALLAEMLEKRGARVIRCPLVAIKDNPDQDSVRSWLARIVEAPPDLFIFYTGEGIERLVSAAGRSGLEDAFVETLKTCRILCRGPKPKRALSRLGVIDKTPALNPTTEGVIATLGQMDLESSRIAVQLYGDRIIPALDEYLRDHARSVDYVAPYVYASAADNDRVAELIDQLCTDDIDAIAFTSKTQIERLVDVARQFGKQRELRLGLHQVRIAAVGPVVAEKLAALGYRASIQPERSYFMKPLVTALCDAFAKDPR